MSFFKETELAPIVLTVYKRPWHTEQTLKALQANDLADQSILYVYSDGPKHLALKEDIKAIEEVRELVRSQQWCKEVHLIESPYNIGLVSSFVKSISEVVNRHGKVIVLEDDQVTSKGFLKYMNEALELYKNDEQVMHVSGYMYPVKFESKETTFFLNVQSCPGWGTWKRAWKHYNNDAVDHLNYFSQNKKRIKKFNIEGNAFYFKQLEKNTEVINYSWAVKWYASCLREGGMSLFPSKSLVQNIGLDGTGEHCKPSNRLDVETIDYLPIYRIPIQEDKDIRKAVDLWYKSTIKKRKSYKEIVKSIFYKLGIKYIKSGARWVLRKIYPELVVFDSFKINMNRSLNIASEFGKDIRLRDPYFISKSIIGDYTNIGENSKISLTKIGKFCCIGPNFYCGRGIHPTDCLSIHSMFYSTQNQKGLCLSKNNKVQERKPITIGNDVFIGMNVTILDGVTIGTGAVIGAGAVVSKDIPPYSVAVGCPIKVIKYRFNENTIQKLLKIRWWDWPEEKLQDVERYFFKVEEFVRKNSDT